MFFHYPVELEGRVKAWFDRFAVPSGPRSWSWPDRDSPTFRVEVDNSYRDWEPETVDRLKGLLGGEVGCTVVDVTGKIPALSEVLELTTKLLGAVPGVVASDDWSDHFWRLREIENATVVNGLRFFVGEK